MCIIVYAFIYVYMRICFKILSLTYVTVYHSFKIYVKNSYVCMHVGSVQFVCW